MQGVGLDMIEVSRIKKSIKRVGFLKHIFGELEKEQLSKKKFNAESVAGNFCAKEAFSKSIGTGIRGFSFRDVQVLRDDLGKPFLVLSGEAQRIAKKNKYEFSVSITHTKNIASAVVICYKK